MMCSFLYFATRSGQLGHVNILTKWHSHFKNAHLVEPLYTVLGWGGGGLFPLGLEALRILG